MTTPSANLLKALVIYGIVVPLALWVGYMVITLIDNPRDLSSWSLVLVALSVLASPLLLKWHRPLLFLAWNMNAILLFLPGGLPVWMGAAVLSLIIYMVQRALVSDMRFISAPSVAAPLIFLVAVVLFTQRLTGGFGLRIFGSGTVGGKSYLAMYLGVAGYFAMIAYRIPRDKALLYAGLFLLGPLTDAISSAADVLPWSFRYIYLVFPLENMPTEMVIGGLGGPESVARYTGLCYAGMALVWFLLARYGIREMLSLRKPWRLLLAGTAFAGALFGGYRSQLATVVMVPALIYLFEGLLRTRYTVMLVVLAVAVSAVTLPLANRMPRAFQRAVSFLPVDVDPDIRMGAEGSTEWRVNMWQRLLPEVPKYFWLGRGAGIPGLDLELAMQLEKSRAFAVDDPTVMAGNFHSGPFSMLLFFGVWGAIGWIWFVAASLRALYRNYLYGDDALKKINTFLLALFATKAFGFFFLYGDIRADLAPFAGIVGLGLALNHGICRPLLAKVRTAQIPIRVRPPIGLAPGLSR